MDAIANLSGYQIGEQLYVGFKTLVYRAIRESDGQPVVIKLLHNPLPSFSELVQFRNQYTIAKNLNLPSIVKPLSLEAYGNSYALIMEDFGGVSLSTYLKGDRQQPADIDENQPDRSLPLAEFLNLALQLTDILHYLSQNRVIHKDIKPANILINPDSKQVKLIDFSIASLLPREIQEIHNPNILEGTLAYLSPEQTGRMNRALDYRTDFYSLGVTCYQLLTGKLPFISEYPMELVHCHLAKQPIPAHQINPDIPVVLSEIVSKLMEKNAENRYQSGLGLKHDLANCLAQFQETGDLQAFLLGENDICDRFIIPEKLYGRATEVASLLAAFERVAGRELENKSPIENRKSKIEMMLVAGFSGIGKTVVVNEVHKPIVRHRGYFISGKYDQFQRNIPFSAFVQAFRDLMAQLLSESDAKLQEWQTKIQQAVGENGQVIVEIIPELERIIGQQQPASELSGIAAENRFNLVFKKFISVFTAKEHPLVIFLDDLQWSDSASLKLLQLLTGETDSQHLLIIGAYRDNEVFPTHPFMVAVAEMEKAGTVVNTITLQPLTQADVNDLIADTLICDRPLAQPLTELVYQKTKGNPFFATQFLKSLHENGLIVFDATPFTKGGQRGRKGGWQCDIAKVKALSITSDVVEFMALQLQKLPPATQNVLKLAACIGGQFDLNTLALVSEKPPEETAADLWRALSEGFILPTSEIYKFYQGQEERQTTDLLPTIADKFPSYKFLHDRVQQAAYSSIADDEKQATHLKIGRLLQENFTELEAEEKLFDIVGHLNRGIESSTEAREREILAELNLAAGGKARNSIAYVAALTYLQTGIELLEAECWQSQYKLTLNLYIAATEAAYLNADFEAVEQMAAIVLQYAQTILDKVKIYEVQIAAQTAQGKPLEAIAVARDALGQLGVELRTESDETKIDEALQALKHQLEGRKIAELIDLPAIGDPQIQAAMQVLGMLFGPIMQGMPGLLPLLSSTMVSLSIEFGNAPASTVGYAIYGMVLSAFFGEVETGYDFGRLSLSLLDRLNCREFKSIIMVLFGGSIQPRQEAFLATIPTTKDGYMAGVETGDFLYAAYNISNYSYLSFFSSVYLNNLAPEIAGYSGVLAQLKQDSAQVYLDVLRQVVQNLRERVNQPDCLIGTAYDEREMFGKHHQDHDFSALCLAYIYKLLLAYLFGNYADAVGHIAKAKQYLMAVSGMVFVPIFHFYAALTHLSLFPTLPEIEQVEILLQVEIHQTTLHQWAQTAPMNYLHKWHLVEAQRHRVLGNKTEAIENYDRAISLAKENQFLNEEALANELAAKFYLNWGKEKVAIAYMQAAYYCYARWGAKAKIDDLETHYPQLLTAIFQARQNHFSISDTRLETLDRSSALNRTIHTTRSSSSSISESLDFATILKASQALSSEIQLEQLVATLMQVVMENAGAKKAGLLLLQDGILMVEALAYATENVSILSVPLSSFKQIPVTLINYVKRSLKTVIFDDSTTQNNFLADPYLIQEKPKSVLCAPILNQGKLIGLLYLENQLTIGAFTRDRTELIQLLCAQAAISLENARLYQQSQIHAQQLERSLKDLQDSQTQLIKSAAFLEAQRESSLDGILVVDANRQVSAYNQAFVKIWNIPQNILETKDSRQFLGFVLDKVEQPDKFLAMVEYLYQHPDEASYHEIILKDRRILERYSVNVKLPSGEECGRIWYFRDISAPKLAEINLQQSNLLLQSVVEATSDMIFAKDSQHRYLFANSATLQLLGLSTEAEIVGKTDFDVLPLEFSQNIQEWDERVLRSGIAEKFEEDVVNAAGQIVNLYTTKTPMRDRDGNIIGTVGMTRDITELKQAEKSLQETNTLLNSVLETMPNLFVAKDLEGRHLALNSNLAQFFGKPVAEIIGKTDAELLPPKVAAPIMAKDREIITTGITERFEEIVPTDGVNITYLTVKTPLRDADGNTIGLIGMAQNISDRKQAEAAVIQKSQQLEQTLDELKQAQLQMVQNEKMATLGNLVAGVAHEINNPIGFISASVNNIEEYVQYLLDHVECYQKYYPDPVPEVIDSAEDIDLEFLIEDLPKLIASMKIASQRIREISNSLRTFSRADTAEKVACDIHEGINSTLLILKYRLKASEKRPAIKVIAEYGKLPLVKCFLGQLNQVFMNIIANAIDALDAASVGQTFAEIQAHPQLITICTEVSGDRQMAVIRIRDNGPGMSEEIQAHIFDHLFTTKEVGKGTGLGLAIARQIVEEKHGGKLSCISAPSKGTEFVIEVLID